MSETKLAGRDAAAYPYDPENLWLLVQTDEPYAHVYDHLDTALSVAGGGEAEEDDEGEDDEDDEDDYRGQYCEPEAVPRSPLERVGPILFDVCRSIPAGVLPPELERALQRAVAHAGRTEYLDDIVAATRAWWLTGPGK